VTADAASARLPPAFAEYAEEPLAQAPAGGPGKRGLLEATFAREADGPTRLVRDRVRVPYHHTGTIGGDPAPALATLLVQEPTGGLAQGDRHRLAVEAGPGARAHVTTQGATKVHSMRANYAHLDVSLLAAAGSHLEYLPGPTIVNEDARCLGTTHVEVADDAVVILADVLVPDGLSDHEPFGFDHYHATVEAERDGRLVCADAVDLRPGDPRDPATVGEFAVVGSLYVFAPAVPLEALVETVADRLGALEAVHAGVSTLPEDAGAIVRILGHRETDVSAAVRAAWDETRRRTLGVGAPADRRY